MIWTHLAAAILAAVLSFVGAWQVQDWRYAAKDKVKLEQAIAKKEDITEKIDVAAERHEVVKEVIRKEFVPIYKEVDRVVEKIVYRDTVCFDDDGLRVLKDAINGHAKAASESPAKLP